MKANKTHSKHSNQHPMGELVLLWCGKYPFPNSLQALMMKNMILDDNSQQPSYCDKMLWKPWWTMVELT